MEIGGLCEVSLMSTLEKIESEVPGLSAWELLELERFVQSQRRKTWASSGHSVLDIPAVSVGRMLRLFPADDDLLGEMLDGRL